MVLSLGAPALLYHGLSLVYLMLIPQIFRIYYPYNHHLLKLEQILSRLTESILYPHKRSTDLTIERK